MNKKSLTIPRRLFSKHFLDVLESKQRYVILCGGRGSSKTYTIMLKLFLLTFSNEKHNIYYSRDTWENVRKKTFVDMYNFLEFTGLEKYFKYSKATNGSMQFINKLTNNIIIPFSLQNENDAKGLSEASVVWIDEANSMKEELLAAVNSSIRSPNAPYLQLILSFNLVNEKHYLRKMFFDLETNDFIPRKDYGNDILINHSTLHNNEYIAVEKYEQELKRIYANNPNALNVNLWGLWGDESNEAPWFYNFKKDKHVSKNLPYYKNDSIYLCVDFNTDPLCAIIAQNSINYRESRILREYRIPKAHLEDLADAVLKDYKSSQIFLIADATGFNGNVGYTKSDWNSIIKLQRLLGLSDYQLRFIAKSNLSHKNSRQLCNSVLLEHINFKIDASCEYLIKDLTIGKVHPKRYVEEELYKDSAEYNMNLGDCFRYYIDSLFYDFIHQIKPRNGRFI